MLKTNATKFEYLSEGERLFLKVTIFGRIKESKELATIVTKLMNRYPGGQEHLFNKFYTIKKGSDLVPYVRSNKKLFVSIFYLDNYREKVDLHVPYNSTVNKLIIASFNSGNLVSSSYSTAEVSALERSL